MRTSQKPMTSNLMKNFYYELKHISKFRLEGLLQVTKTIEIIFFNYSFFSYQPHPILGEYYLTIIKFNLILKIQVYFTILENIKLI